MIIDEDRLAEAMVAIGDAIEIPAGGPERILDLAGTSRPSRRLRPPRPGWLRPPTLAAACLVLLLVAVGALALRHGGPSAPMSSAASPVPSPTTSPTSAGAAGESTGQGSVGTAASGGTAGGAAAGGTGSGAAGSASRSTTGATAPGSPTALASGQSPSPGPPPAPAAPAAALPTRVIKTGDVVITVAKGQVSSAVNRLTTLAASLGGFIADSKSAESSTGPTGDVTVRVPSDQFEALIAKVHALGTTVSSSTSGQDVTAQYVDLQARIASLQASRTQYLQIMQRAQAIGDVLAVQNQLDNLQAQIEQLQGQLNVLTNQTTYSTLAVHVSDSSADPVAAPLKVHRQSGLSRAWAHARHSFARGLESIVAALGGIAVFLLALAALALIGRGLWEIVRRRLV